MESCGRLAIGLCGAFKKAGSQPAAGSIQPTSLAVFFVDGNLKRPQKLLILRSKLDLAYLAAARLRSSFNFDRL